MANFHMYEKIRRTAKPRKFKRSILEIKMKNTNRIYNTIIITIAIMLGITNSNADVHENMVLIPAKDGIDEFYIDKYEVTNAEYKQFIDANPIWQKENVLLSIVGRGC